MKKIAILSTIALAFTFSITAADKSNEAYINDLKSDDQDLVNSACLHLGKEEEKKAIDEIINAIKTSTNNTGTKVSCIDALSKMGEKGKPTTSLKEVVETDKDNSVVYSALLAILNLKDFENEDAEMALAYADTNKEDDDLISDVVKRIRKAMEKAK